jgi:TonB-linked SusC/RagA family outer membrane protein
MILNYKKVLVVPIKNSKILFLLFFFLISSVISAQNQKVTLPKRAISIQKIFHEIESQTGLSVDYNHNTIDITKEIKVDSDILSNILNTVLAKSGMKYKIESGHVIIVPNKNLNKQSDQMKPKAITGTVLDLNGESIIGANIVEQGTTNGTVTDLDGRFTLNVPANAILEISYIGYKDKFIPVDNSETLTIKLLEDTQVLDEVVIVGYGTQKRQAITGSVAKAKLDVYQNVPTNNVMEAIKGSLPGLNIGGTNKAGEVGGFSIRGTKSTGAGNTPLIVLDGAIYDGSLADIPSEDIENFTVLKDASAAAIYGSRSANGVILIQTKRGRGSNGKAVLNFKLSYGISNEMERLEVYDAEGYLKRMLDIRAINGLEADPNNINLYLEPEEQKNYNATADHQPTLRDPYDSFRQNAYNLKANVSISNSTDLANYYISTSLTDQQGVVLNDRYKNFSGRVNINSNLTSWLKVGIKSNYSIRDYSGSEPRMDLATQLSPYASIYDDNGAYRQYPQTTTSLESPFWSMATDDLSLNNNLNAILDATISVPWVKGLSYSLTYSNGLRWDESSYFYDEFTTSGQGKSGKGQREFSKKYNMLLDNVLKYNNTFAEKHNLDLTLLYSRERRTWNSTTAYAENFDNTVLGDNKLEDGKKQTVNTGAGESGAIGMMARGTYSFDNKYSITGTVRRDGCSSFSVNKKWGLFSSVGLNWTVSNEPFLEDVDLLNNLAFRLSYGSNGNQSISSYSTLAKVGTNKYIYAGDPSYSITQAISSFALNNLGWETTTGLNFGIDFSILNERISGAVEAYNTTTRDLLFKLAIPYISGKGEILSNLGEIENKGFEVSLYTVPIKNRNFEWSSDFAFSLNRNKVATIYGEDNDGDGKEDDLINSGYFIGKPLGTIYSYKVTGMWQQSDVDDGTIMDGMRPGDYKLEDVNGDGKITSDEDRQFLGDSNANFRWSWTNTLTYKDLSLFIYFNSVWGGNGHFLSGSNTPYNDPYVNSGNLNRTVYDYWTSENTDATYPRPDYAKASYRGTKYMDRSFIKLQKVALNYNLSKYVKPFGIEGMSASISADNLFTIAPHWDGLDPETGAGVTISSSPSIRTYLMTLMFNF